MVDDCLTWKQHVNVVMNRVIINKKILTNAKYLLNIDALKSVYHGHTCSHLTYGLVVWESMITNQVKDELYRLQKQCI